MGRMDFPGKWRLCFSIFSCLKFPKFCSSINLIHYINITISQVNDCAKLLQSCLTHCDLMDCSPPGSSVHGVLQERILEWAAIPFSRGSSWPRDRTHISWGSCTAGGFFTLEPLGKPQDNDSIYCILPRPETTLFQGTFHAKMGSIKDRKCQGSNRCRKI